MAEIEQIDKMVIKTGGKVYEFDGGGSGIPAPDSVGTEQIKDGAVEEEDLNENVKDKMTVTHDSSTGGLRIGGYAKPGDVPANKTQEDVGQGGGEDEDLDDQPGGGFNDPMLEEEGD